MFRVLDNGDGSTSIFCNETGRLVCTIGGQNRSMGLGGRPVNVVGPTPQARRSSYYNIDQNPLLDEDEEKNSREKELEECDEPKEDFYDDCIAPDDFARCLNLVSKEKLRTESIDQLKSTFPLRHLSRSKEILAKDNLRDIKLPEDLPLTCSLGLKIMKINQPKNFYNDQNIEMKIKHYDSFCRFPLNTPSVCGNFPKLRCREKKEYPIYLSPKFSKYSPTHMYTFNRKQRLEKLITFRTGLDTRSRRLLMRCNKKLAVNIERLTPKEIEFWLEKRSGRGPITADCIQAEEPVLSYFDCNITANEENSPPLIDLESLSSDSSDSEENSNDPSFVYNSRRESIKLPLPKEPLKVPQNSLSPLKKKNGQLTKWLKNSPVFENCSVHLENVLCQLQKCSGDYYFSGTAIRVPFCQDFLNRLDPKARGAITIPEVKQLRNNHVHRRPLSQVVSRKRLFSNSQCLNQKSPKTKKFQDRTKVSNGIQKSSSTRFNNVKNSNSLNSLINKNLPQVALIPIIDLTSDSDSPVKKVKHTQNNKSCNWKFHCYGCHYERKLIDEGSAYSIATQHMKEFHSVADVNAFLGVKKCTKSGVTLEAFPGYNS